MPRTVTQITLLLASPGDRAKERAAVRRAADEVNRSSGERYGFHLLVKGWETHTRPAATEEGRAQSAIFEQIGDYDVFLGVMGARVGTPTGKAASGTIEEYEAARLQWSRRRTHKPSVLFYFLSRISASIDALDADQLKAAQTFKKRVFNDGLAREYATVTQFEGLVREHLTHEAHAILDRAAAPKPKRTPAKTPATRTTPRKRSAPAPSTPAVLKLTAPRIPAPVTDARRRAAARQMLDAIRAAFASGRRDFNSKHEHLRMSVRKDGNDAFLCRITHDEAPLLTARLAISSGALFSSSLWSIDFGTRTGLEHLPFTLLGVPVQFSTHETLTLTEHSGRLRFTLPLRYPVAMRQGDSPDDDPRAFSEFLWMRTLQAVTQALHTPPALRLG